MKRIILASIIAVILPATCAYAWEITLGWDHDAPETVVEYEVYVRNYTSGSGYDYDYFYDIVTELRVPITNLNKVDTYCFVIRAANEHGPSVNSEELCIAWSLFDDDTDGVINGDDIFPDDPTEWDDTDLDGIGDNSDPDIDDDGILNDADAFPYDLAVSIDTDGDGSPDSWNIGMTEADSTTGLYLDEFPNDPNEWADNDNDGIGDNEDIDDDNDNISDATEIAMGFDPFDNDSHPLILNTGFGAEDYSAIDSPMTLAVDPHRNSFGGRFIEVPNNAFPGGSVEYKINIETDGIYYLFARTKNTDIATGNIVSFQIDSDSPINWDLTENNLEENTWAWNTVNNNETGNQISVFLTAGYHTITMVSADSGFAIDHWCLSNISDYILNETVPDLPTQVQGAQIDGVGGKIIVSWQANPDEDNVTQYIVYYGLFASSLPYAITVNSGTGAEIPSYLIGNMVYATITAVSDNGYGPLSVSVSKDTAKPTQVQAISSEFINDHIVVSWSANPVEENVTKYVVYYGLFAASQPFTIEVNEGTGAMLPDWLIGMTAYLKIVAVNGFGNSQESNLISINTAPPTTVTGVNIDLVNGTPLVSWTANPDGENITSYTVKYGFFSTSLPYTVDAQTNLEAILPWWLQYYTFYVQVIAHNQFGESAGQSPPISYP